MQLSILHEIDCKYPKKSNIHAFIGVSHTESRFMNTDSLLNVLQKVKPDLILDEMQSPKAKNQT